MRRRRQVNQLLSLSRALKQGERQHVAQFAARLQFRRETVNRDLRTFKIMWFPVVSDIHRVTTRPRLDTHLSANVVPIPFSPEEFLVLDFAALPRRLDAQFDRYFEHFGARASCLPK